MSKTVANEIKSGDLIVSLKYDTVFELALTQRGRAYSYSTSAARDGNIIVYKPHGSLSLVVNDGGFTFS